MHNNIWDHKLLVVIGKGGVGRTSIAAGLGIAAAKCGKRTCVVEISGLSDVSRIFGFEAPAYEPREAFPGLDVRSISAADCLNDFVKRKLRLGRLSQRFIQSRALSAFIDAVPGLQDLLQLGKIENAMNEPLKDEPHYDLTILDAPATGHGLSMLSAARTMRRMARVGPFAELARIIEVWLSDRSATGFVLVTLAEELPVHECLHFVEQLGEDRRHLDTIVFNRLTETSLPKQPPWPTIEAHLRAQKQHDLTLIAEGIGSKVGRSIEEKERSAALLANLDQRFGLQPRVAHVRQRRGDVLKVADDLFLLGASE